MRKGKKTVLFLLTIACLTFLAGFAVKTVELLNENPPLIDLSLAIEVPLPGLPGNDLGQNGDDIEKSSEQLDNVKIVEIKIRGEELRMDGHKHFSIEKLGNSLRKKCESLDWKIRIILIDDYAEYHCYKEVFELLEKLKQEKGCDIEEK